MTNINFLLTISIDNQEERLWEFKKLPPNEKCFDLLSNSLDSYLKEIYRDQFGEFVCGYWGLKGKLILFGSFYFRWVLLKNVHLAPQWLVTLEKKLHTLNPHAAFRLFMTMEINPKVYC